MRIIERMTRYLTKIAGWLTVIVIIGLAFHTPITVWLSTLNIENILLIKSWKEMLLGIALLSVVVIGWRSKRLHNWQRDWLVRLAVLYGLLHIVLLFLNWQGVQAAAAGLLIDLRLIVALLVGYLITKIAPEWRRIFMYASAAAAVIVVTFLVLQVTVLPRDSLALIGYNESTIEPYQTIDQNTDYIRHQSTLRGPNPLGAFSLAVIIVLAWAFRYVKKSNWSYGIVWIIGFIATLISLLTSYSRSAWVGAFIGSMGYAITVYRHQLVGFLKNWKGVALLAVSIISVVLFSVLQPRLFSTVILHEDPAEVGKFNSNDGHLESLVDGLGRMVNQPLGAGVGSTGSASLLGDNPIIIENQYLFIAHEAGWIGLIIFLTLGYIIAVRLYNNKQYAWLWVGVGLCVVGLFLPVFVDDVIAILYMLIAGSLAVKKTD